VRVVDALDPGDDALEESDVDVWRDMWSDEVGDGSSLIGVGVCLCQLWGGVGGGGKVCGGWLAAGRVGAICR
jgi:hypothetical protein